MLDGKQPGVAILYGASQLLPFDPLISMRFVSIVFSVISFLCFTLLSKRIFKNNSAEFFLLLLAFCPYLIFFDSLALPEAIITACFAMIFLVLHSFLQEPRVWKGIFIGGIVGFGWWFKSSILLSIPLIFLSLALYFPNIRTNINSIILGSALGIVLGFIIIFPVLFNPNVAYESTQVIQRTRDFSEIIATSFATWGLRLWQISSWIWGFAGPLISVGFLLSFFIIRVHRMRLLLLFWFIGPIVLEVILLKSMTGRLLAMTIPFFLLFVSQILDVKHGKLFGLVLGFTNVFLGLLLVFSPLAFNKYVSFVSKESYSDFGQYISGWTSGWGVKEAISYLKDTAKKSPIVVFVRLDGGNPEDAVLSYMRRYDIPVFYTTQYDKVKNQIDPHSVDMYFVSRGKQYDALEGSLIPKKVYSKPLGDEFVGVYEIFTDSEK